MLNAFSQQFYHPRSISGEMSLSPVVHGEQLKHELGLGQDLHINQNPGVPGCCFSAHITGSYFSLHPCYTFQTPSHCKHRVCAIIRGDFSACSCHTNHIKWQLVSDAASSPHTDLRARVVCDLIYLVGAAILRPAS